MSSKWDDIKKCIEGSERILIFTHANMDGDALGSSQALCHALRDMGKDAYIILEDEIPKYLDILHSHDDFFVRTAPWDEYIAIAVDCGDESRIENRVDAFRAAGKRICIDHHPKHDGFADYSVVEPEASATGILIYELIKDLGVEIDKHIAEDIYAAISTDTGSFMYNNTDARTHLVAAELYAFGIDHVKICNAFYATFPLIRLKLEARAIDHLIMCEDGRVAISYITNADLKELGGKYEDTDTCVDRLRSIEGVEASCMLKETEEGTFKASLRGNTYADVYSAAKALGGGGHKMAAGCTLETDLETAIERVKTELAKVL